MKIIITEEQDDFLKQHHDDVTLDNFDDAYRDNDGTYVTYNINSRNDMNRFGKMFDDSQKNGLIFALSNKIYKRNFDNYSPEISLSEGIETDIDISRVNFKEQPTNLINLMRQVISEYDDLMEDTDDFYELWDIILSGSRTGLGDIAEYILSMISGIYDYLKTYEDNNFDDDFYMKDGYKLRYEDQLVKLYDDNSYEPDFYSSAKNLLENQQINTYRFKTIQEMINSEYTKIDNNLVDIYMKKYPYK